MIMVAMIGMSILFGYVVFYTDNYKAGVGSSVLEHLTIEDVWVKTDGTVWISVYNPSTRGNLGADVDLQVTTIFVDGRALQNADASSENHLTINFNDQTVNAGEHAVFKATSMPPLETGIMYNLKIVTLRSSSFESQFTA